MHFTTGFPSELSSLKIKPIVSMLATVGYKPNRVATYD